MVVDPIELSARSTAIDGLLLLTMKQVGDDRGTVREFYRESAFREVRVPALGPWVQVNVTHTRQGALRGLTTRADDDFTIALIDAWAVVSDVLTFYQERQANEHYLRTATERRSIALCGRHFGWPRRSSTSDPRAPDWLQSSAGRRFCSSCGRASGRPRRA